MSERIALVTGGIGGLGSAICRQLAGTGMRVIAADLPNRGERLAAFRSEMAEFGERVAFVALDVTDFEACNRTVAEAEQRHGRIDILANVAGITRDAILRKMEKAQWDQLLAVNLDGIFHMSRAVIEGMLARGYGRIVNISSVNGQTGQFGQTNYSAAKAGVHGFTMALAREVAAKGITVNTVSPGYCQTEMVMAVPEAIRAKIVAQIPVGRLGSPEDIGRAVAFLAGEHSGYITGANLPVNGGYFMSF